MKIKKILLISIIAAVLAALVTTVLVFGAAHKKKQAFEEVTLYFYSPSDSTVAEERRAIPKNSNPNAFLADVESAYRFGPKGTNLIKAIPNNVDFVIKNNNAGLKDELQIDLTSGFNELSDKDKLVCLGSLVYTFSGLDFINNVKLTVDGENIAEDYGVFIGESAVLNTENVVNNPIINPERINRQKVVLYFLNVSGTRLIAEERRIEVKQSQTLEYQIVEQLIAGPEDSDLKPTIHQSTKIKDIKTEDGICYVNLSSDFVNKLAGTTNNEKLIIYSIVNSLTELNTVNKVQFLIEGERISEYKGHYDFSKTFERDPSLIGI